jgi:hypothetical protein
MSTATFSIRPPVGESLGKKWFLEHLLLLRNETLL